MIGIAGAWLHVAQKGHDRLAVAEVWEGVMQALRGMRDGPLEQVPIQDYFPAAKELSPVEFAAQ